jgi:hypothetical protein
MAVNLVQNADGSLTMLDEGTGLPVGRFGGPATRVGGAIATNTNVPNYRTPFLLTMRLQGPTDTAGGIAALANPFGTTAYVLPGGVMGVTTASGACTVAFGIAANGTTSAANILAATSTAATGATPLTLATTWTTSQFFTASTSTGASVGLVGFISIPILIP